MPESVMDGWKAGREVSMGAARVMDGRPATAALAHDFLAFDWGWTSAHLRLDSALTRKS
jgi:hypothetical protein